MTDYTGNIYCCQDRLVWLPDGSAIVVLDQTMPQKRRAPPRKAHDETLGQRLARLRRERALSQSQLAAHLGVSQANVSDYERDEVRLHSDLIVALTEILKISADELLGITPPHGRIPVKDRRFLPALAVIDLLPKRDKDALLRTLRLYASKVCTSID